MNLQFPNALSVIRRANQTPYDFQNFLSCEENVPQTTSEQSTDNDEATVPTYEMISSPSREHVNIYDLINTDIQTGEQDRLKSKLTITNICCTTVYNHIYNY